MKGYPKRVPCMRSCGRTVLVVSGTTLVRCERCRLGERRSAQRLRECRCAWCGKRFYPEPKPGPPPVYCSEDCHAAQRYAWKRRKPRRGTCKRCGRRFPQRPGVGAPRSLCGREDCADPYALLAQAVKEGSMLPVGWDVLESGSGPTRT